MVDKATATATATATGTVAATQFNVTKDCGLANEVQNSKVTV